jgi:hypothetical protein
MRLARAQMGSDEAASGHQGARIQLLECNKEHAPGGLALHLLCVVRFRLPVASARIAVAQAQRSKRHHETTIGQDIPPRDAALVVGDLFNRDRPAAGAAFLAVIGATQGRTHLAHGVRMVLRGHGGHEPPADLVGLLPAVIVVAQLLHQPEAGIVAVLALPHFCQRLL